MSPYTTAYKFCRHLEGYRTGGGGVCACVCGCAECVSSQATKRRSKINPMPEKTAAEKKLRQLKGWRGEACHLEALPGGWGNA